MIRMRWLALALVCAVTTTAHAQTTQKDTAKAKSAATMAHHKAGAKMVAKGEKMEHKGAAATKAGEHMENAGAAKAGEKMEHAGTVASKQGEKMEKKGKKIEHKAKTKAKADTAKHGG